jgi:hypothetical protein
MESLLLICYGNVIDPTGIHRFPVRLSFILRSNHEGGAAVQE